MTRKRKKRQMNKGKRKGKNVRTVCNLLMKMGKIKKDFYYDLDGNDSYATIDSSDNCQDEVVRRSSKFKMYDPIILLSEFEVGFCFEF